MPKTLLITGGDVFGVAATTTGYNPLSTNFNYSGETPEQCIMRDAATLNNFAVNVYSNSINTGSTTVRTRKNGANMNMLVSIGAGLTGTFEDLTHSDTLAAADKYDYQIATPGGSTGSIGTSMIAVVHDNTANANETVSRLNVAWTTDWLDGASTSYFLPIIGQITSKSATLTEGILTKTEVKRAGTLRNMALNVDTNNRASSATTVRTRKNGANGNQLISVPASTTGFFEDTTNSDSLVSEDDCGYVATTGAGAAQLFVIAQLSISCVTSGVENGVGIIGGGDPAVHNALNSDNSLFTQINPGYHAWYFVEAPVSYTVRDQFKFSDMTFSVSSNTLSVPAVLRFRTNGQDVNQQLTIPAGATGVFWSHETDYALIGDTVAISLNIPAGTGSISISDMTMATQIYTTPTPASSFYTFV